MSLNNISNKQKTDMFKSLNASNLNHKSNEEVAQMLHVDISKGLSESEVVERRLIYGPNEFEHEKEDPLWYKYLCQFKEPMMLLLLISAFISLCMKQFDDAASITLALIIVCTVGFVQEYRSEKTIEALKELMPPKCRCLRDGTAQNIMAKDLVPGDVVLLFVGDRVPADIRLFECNDLFIDESSFTGETEPMEKSANLSHNGARGEAQGTNNHNKSPCVAFMGTLVRCGKGRGIVIGTGANSEFGEIFKMVNSQEPPKTPMQKSMDILGKHLSVMSFGIITLIVIVGLIQGRSLLSMFTIAVSLAVAAIPEGLPIVVTVTLAIGQYRMSKRNAIVKKLPAVETLGCVNVICSDKTGTLTKNEMTITKIVTSNGDRALVTGVGYSAVDGRVIYEYISGDCLGSTNASEDLIIRKLSEVGYVCNNSVIVDGILSGQPTEGAFVCLANKLNLPDRNIKFTRTKEWQFSSETKTMMVKCVNNNSKEELLMMKGAVESVINNCRYFYGVNGVVGSLQIRQLDDGKIQQIMNEASQLGSNGFRVVALAESRVNQTNALDSLVYCGMVAISDPAKPDVDQAIALIQSSGVRVAMITGDSQETACAIATQLGIFRPGMDKCASGPELDTIPFDRLVQEIVGITVFYRTSPRHKSTIVKALQARQLIVAMTGDGVNDAVALKSSDIGVAMGLMGTDVCREAASIVLLDDNFSTIIAAMEEGKTTFHNIRNFLRFQLSTSIAALSLITLSTLFDLPNPLNAMQILWINILMDGPPAQSLGVEPADPDIIRQPPRKAQESIMNRRLLFNAVLAAICIVSGTMWIFHREMSDNLVTRRDITMTFTCFVFFDMFNALSCRSQKKSIFSIGFFTNRYFLVAVGFSLIGQMLVIYVPFFQYIFQTEALDFKDLILLLVTSSTVFIVSEIKKLIERNHLYSLDHLGRYLQSKFSTQTFIRKKTTKSDTEDFV